MPSKLKKILDEYTEGLSNILDNKIEKVILYGSYARGEQSSKEEISDIDIMILVKSNSSEIKDIEKIVLDYSYNLDLKYNIVLSPMVENIDVFYKRTKYMSFYKNVMNEGVILSKGICKGK